MSGYYNYAAEHVINAFLWEALVDEGLLTESDYSRTPIIPVGQIKEFMDKSGDAPFIVYSSSSSGNGMEWFVPRDYITYMVYSTNSSRVRSVVNFMDDLLKRQDDSAIEVNSWAGRDQDSLAVGEELDPLFKNFVFQSIETTAKVPLDPYVNDNGRYNGMITIACTYVTPTDENGKRVFALEP